MRDQYERILDGLRRPGGICSNELGITDFRKRVSELRGMGYRILDRWEDSTNGGRHKAYWLEGQFTPEDVAEADQTHPFGHHCAGERAEDIEPPDHFFPDQRETETEAQHG